MKTLSLDSPHNARTTYTAVKNLFEKQTGFSAVECNDELFVVKARHGAWLSPFSESVQIKVVATSTQSCKVVIESSSRSVLNLLNFGANRNNVSQLSDYISNEVYRLMGKDEIPMTRQALSQTNIRIASPTIKIKGSQSW